MNEFEFTGPPRGAIPAGFRHPAAPDDGQPAYEIIKCPRCLHPLRTVISQQGDIDHLIEQQTLAVRQQEEATASAHARMVERDELQARVLELEAELAKKGGFFNRSK